jgi:hypothetical protein
MHRLPPSASASLHQKGKKMNKTTTADAALIGARSGEHRAMNRRIGALGVLMAAVLPITLATSSQAATAVNTVETPATSSFDLLYGATRLQGSVVWYYRTAHITGSIKAVSGTRQALFIGTGVSAGEGSCTRTQTRTTPAGTAIPFGFDLSCDINGGFDSFKIALTDGSNQLTSLTIGQP